MKNSTEPQREAQESGNLTKARGSPISAIKILLVNDERLVREGLRLILCGYPEFSVVATARDKESVLRQILLHRPHIVLIGLESHIAGTDSIETTRIICRQHAHTRVVILASSPHPFHMREAFMAGAHGYLSKDIEKGELRASLQAVYREGAVLPHDMASHVLRMISGSPLIEGDPLSGLNEKERKILFMMAHGHDTNHIATSLSLSPKTVRNYFSRIYAKLGTENRLRTALYARCTFARSGQPQGK
ncbi:MAG: response regulator transcription factor [Pseudonocardiaceae bacterium]